MPRDLVRLESNERVDRGDVEVLQHNVRSAIRMPWSWFLLEGDSDGIPPGSLGRIIRGFDVVEDSGGPSAQVEVSNGVGLGLVLDGESNLEGLDWFGQEGPSTQNLDFSSQAVATYNVYIRPSIDPGVQGTRIFWNDNITAEEADAINTRRVFGWDTTFALASPGSEWTKVAEVVWGGATIVDANITKERNFLWESNEGASFDYPWGGGTDRDATRADLTVGIFDYRRWVNMVRTQLKDIIGVGDYWDLATADLAETRAHIDQTVDAHSASPQWTGTALFNDFTVSGQHVGDLVSDAFVFDVTREVQTSIDMMALAGLVNQGAGVIVFTGTWLANVFAATLNPPGHLPFIYVSGILLTNRIDIPIPQAVRTNTTLVNIVLVCEVEAGNVDIDVSYRELTWTGTSTVVTVVETDSQNVVSGSRRAIEYTFTSPNPQGSQPVGVSNPGNRFQSIRIECTAISAGAPDFGIYGIHFVYADTEVLDLLGSS